MSRTSEKADDLKRRFHLLSLLDGTRFSCSDGEFLAAPVRVVDAGLLAHCCEERGAPSSAEFVRTVACRSALLELTPGKLAAMQRDIKALGRVPELWKRIAEEPRTYRRFGASGPEWLS